MTLRNHNIPIACGTISNFYEFLFAVDNLIADFRLLYQIDEEVTNIVQNQYRKITKLNRRKSLGFHKLSGSLAEGCFSPSYFSRDDRFEDNIQKSMDMDVEIPIFGLSKKYRDCVVVNMKKKGFAAILLKGDNCSCDECFWYLIHLHGLDLDTRSLRNSLTDADGYLLPYKLKRLLAEKNNYPYNTGKSENYIFALMLQESVQNVKTKQRAFNITKATFRMSYNVFVNEKLALLLSVDFSMVIKLQFRSVFINEWASRLRHWPNMKYMRGVLDTTYLIAKPSHAEKHNESTREFRYSFSHIERKLVSLQSHKQRLIYYIAKSIFYRWMKPIDPDILTSFLLKNTFMWMCEEYGPDHLFWGRDSDQDIKKAIKYLYLQMLKTFREGHMPYYFIPEVNVLNNIPKRLYREIIFSLKYVTMNIQLYVQLNVRAALNIMKKKRMITRKFKDSVEKFEAFGLVGVIDDKIFLETIRKCQQMHHCKITRE